MDQNALGQIVDPEALDASPGARGRLRIEVPEGWMGSELEIAVPAKIMCDRCAGGGCDACDRSGALRAPDEPGERIVRVQVPAGSGAALRIVRPFGEKAGIEQLIVEVRVGASPSPGVVRKTPAPERGLAKHASGFGIQTQKPGIAVRVAFALAVILAVAAALASR